MAGRCSTASLVRTMRPLLKGQTQGASVQSVARRLLREMEARGVIVAADATGYSLAVEWDVFGEFELEVDDRSRPARRTRVEPGGD